MSDHGSSGGREEHCRAGRLLKTTIHYVSSLFCFFHSRISSGVVRFGFVVSGLVRPQNGYSS